MPELTTEIVASATGARYAGPPLTLTGVGTDTRTLTPGSLFVALPGERFDGHAFLAQAHAAGAVAALVQRPTEAPAGLALLTVDDTLVAYGQVAGWWRRQFNPLAVGITGSLGKTSTKELTAGVLSQGFCVLKNAKSFNNEVGLPATLLSLTDAHGALVVEMGMRGPGEIAALAALAQPAFGVITNIGHSHLGRLGSRQAIAAAKGELLDALGTDGLAILNADDAHLPGLAARHRGRTLWFGLRGGDVRALDVRPAGLSGTRFELQLPDGRASVSLPIGGTHMVSNALAAAAVGHAAGLTPAAIAAGLAQPPQLEGRLQLLTLANGARVIHDAYNAAPESVRAGLGLLAAEPTSGRRIAVLAGMLELGDVTEAEHLRLGADAAPLVDLLVGVGDLGALIVDGAGTAVASERVADGAAAGALLARLLRPGDLVLLKGSRAFALESALEALEVARP